MPVAILGAQITLWCFDLQSSSKFKILIGGDNDIDDLKEVIKEKCGFASPLFKLWRVNTNRVMEEMLNDELVDTAQTIGETFYGVVGSNIRVAVNAPEQRIEKLEQEINYLKEKLAKKSVAQLPGTAEDVYIFIDNSNIYIQGKKGIAEREYVCENMVRIDYGKLVEMGQDGRHMGADPVIVGSRPPPEDTLWKTLRNLGYNVTVHDRNCENEEKEVDSEIVRHIVRSVYSYVPGTVILFAGDGDYGPAIREALDKNWIIEIWFWSSGFSTRLTEMYVRHPEYETAIKSRTTIMNLDYYYKKFMFACGYNRYNDSKYLEIFTDQVKDSDIMECYIELGLFGWWYRQYDDTLKLYVNNYSQWVAMKDLILYKYPGAREVNNRGAFCLKKGTFFKMYLSFLNRKDYSA